jgi:Tol biopolymer transport system component
MAADGGELRRLTDHPADDITKSWLADDRWIYFSSDRSGQYGARESAESRQRGGPATRAGGS